VSGRILVTGATGNVGAPLVEHLRTAGADVIAAARDDDLDASFTYFDFTTPGTWPDALDGVDRVFLMRPPPMSNVKRDMRPFIAAMADHGVAHVVFLSLMGVNRAMPHWQIEQDLRSAFDGTASTWTFLRPSFFMQNLTGPFREEIRDRDRITQPAGRGRFSFIDGADIAEAASIVLLGDPPTVNRTLTLTGADAIGYHDVASMLSAELGRVILYRPDGLIAARRALLAAGYDSTYANVQLVINLTARLGMAKKTTGELASLLGRPPTSLGAFIAEHADAWRLT
jgi:uncharacterized protein YbjT (DUF2867 family)